VASTRTTFRVEGLSELDAALIELADEFHPRNARNVLRGALKDGGQIIADAGEANAPRLTGQLAQSYTVGAKLSRRQRGQYTRESAIETFVGPTPHPKSIQTEFGNSHQAAHPHLRPAWDANWRRVLDVITSRAAERLEATRKRLVRRAEREAAKLKASS
jgi:HK97 gp10 family phage protein